MGHGVSTCCAAQDGSLNRYYGLFMDISVIIPTYNQEERLLSLALDSVEKLQRDGMQVECLIVDNNSPTPACDVEAVKQFLQRCPWAKLVVETQQGLTHARIAGIQQTTGAIVLFVDDDNVLTPGYLKTCQSLFERMPHVGVWGAGHITASLLDPVDDWLRGPVEAYHCVREGKHLEYGLVPETWQAYYPIGMGMAVSRCIAESYVQEVLAGKLGASDRKGASLSSAGDCQIVWHAFDRGFAAGVDPELTIDHLVPARRSTVEYLEKVAFGTSSSFLPALYQSYDVPQNRRSKPPASRKVFLRLVITTLRQLKRRRLKLLPVEVAVILGEVIGKARSIDSTNPAWVFSLARRMKLID